MSNNQYSELNESTFVQMAQAIKTLITILDKQTLTYNESLAVAKAIELRQVALSQAKRSGIITEV